MIIGEVSINQIADFRIFTLFARVYFLCYVLFSLSIMTMNKVGQRLFYQAQLYPVYMFYFNPRYEWTFNDRVYDPSGQDNDVTMQTGVGTLLFSRPSSRNEGFYICRAINDFGTAVAGTVQMLNASKFYIPLQFFILIRFSSNACVSMS